MNCLKKCFLDLRLWFSKRFAEKIAQDMVDNLLYMMFLYDAKYYDLKRSAIVFYNETGEFIGLGDFKKLPNQFEESYKQIVENLNLIPRKNALKKIYGVVA